MVMDSLFPIFLESFTTVFHLFSCLCFVNQFQTLLFLIVTPHLFDTVNVSDQQHNHAPAIHQVNSAFALKRNGNISCSFSVPFADPLSCPDFLSLIIVSLGK
jgi:hypothetical protein